MERLSFAEYMYPHVKLLLNYHLSNVITKANYRVKILYFMGITPTPIPWSFFFNQAFKSRKYDVLTLFLQL